MRSNTNAERGAVHFIFLGEPPPAFAGLIGASRLASYSHLPLWMRFAHKGEAGLRPSGASPRGFAARLEIVSKSAKMPPFDS